MKNFLKERKLSSIFEEKNKRNNNVNAEISQKLSISSILYLFFNTNLLKICEQ